MAPVTDFTSASLQANPIIARHMKTMPRKLADERILIPDSLWPNGASLPGVANPYCMFLKSYPIKDKNIQQIKELSASKPVR